MAMQKDILLSVLRLTQNGPVSKQTVVRSLRVPAETAHAQLETLLHAGFFQEYGELIEAPPSHRIRMAFSALSRGADLERVCALLSWNEFETMTAEAFEANGYRTIKNFHFKHNSKRYEIDVVALRNPLIICVDCKHWKHGWHQAVTAKAAESQIERTQAFADALSTYQQSLGIADWRAATVIPVILSLTQNRVKFHDDVPIVQALQIQDFINELPAQAPLLKSFHQKLSADQKELRDFLK